MQKIIFLTVAMLVVGTAQATFVDNRTATASTEIEVVFKSITIEELLTEIAPKGFSVTYARPELRRRNVSINGKGMWSDLLAKSLLKEGLVALVDTGKNSVMILDGPAGAGGQPITPAGSTRPAPAVPVAQVPAPPPPPPPESYRTATNDHQISTVVQRWAKQANMQLVWEPRDVDYQVTAENEWGTDFQVALRGLLESVQGARTRIRACIHANKPRNVVRIINFNDRCKGSN